MKKEVILGIIRHTLTFIGGIFIYKGLIEEGLVQEITGSVLTLVGAIWSIFNKRK